MLFKAHGRLHLVDIEGVLGQARHGRTRYLAAGGEDQAVIADALRLAAGVGVADAAPVAVDRLGAAVDEVDANGVEQVAQRRFHAVHIGLVEARADAQLGLRCEHADADVFALSLVEQASGAQGAPHTGKAGTDDQDVRFHGGAPQGSSEVQGDSMRMDVPLEQLRLY
ncbi:hypothetical protein D3C71_1701010 [compost metagenome]